MHKEPSDLNLAYLVVFALFFTILGMASTTPALNTGDYVRTLETMSLHVGLWTIPSECVPYNGVAPEPPGSTLAVFGMLFSQLDRALGHDCMHHERWSAALSLIYWIGGYVALKRTNGASTAGKLFLLGFVYFLFSGYFFSFYQEAILIALLPWLFVVMQGEQPTIFPLLLVLGMTVFAKTQVVLYLPVFVVWILLAHKNSPSMMRTTSALLVMAAGAWISMAGGNFNVAQNSYNRIFNGIGWSLLAAEDWPYTEFDARHTYFYENEDAFTSAVGQACAPDHLEIMGTTFWPTGDEIWREVRNPQNKTDDAEFVKNLGFSDYMHCLVETGRPVAYLKTIYALFFRSDYSVGYAIKHGGDGTLVEFANSVRGLLLRHLPIVAGVVALGFIVLSRSPVVAITVGYLFFVTPFLIVVADGFFEFEKHMVLSFTFLLGPVLLGATTARSRSSAIEKTERD